MTITRIESHKVNNLAELILVLTRMSLNPLHQISNDAVLIEQAPVKVSLDCETLTDGSEVYNISFGL